MTLILDVTRVITGAKMGGVLQLGGAYFPVAILVTPTAAPWPNSGHSANV